MKSRSFEVREQKLVVGNRREGSNIQLLTSRFLLVLLLSFFPEITFSQTLSDYLQQAAENNPDLNASFMEFEAAMKRVSQVNTLPDPAISFGYFISPIETRVGPQRAKISLTQMFPWFGTLTAKEDATTLMAEARYQEFLKDKYELYRQVKQAYYPIYEVHEHIHWQNQNLTILESYKQLATISFSNGKGAMTDVLRVDMMMDEVKTDIAIFNDNLIPLRVAFNRLLNRPDSSFVRVDESLTIEEVQLNYDKDSISAHNPMLKALHLKLQAMQVNETIAKKKAMPQLGIGLDYAIIGKRSDVNISDNGKNALMPMVTMSLPIYRRKYNAEIGEAQLLQSSIEHRVTGLENTLISSYERAFYEMEKSMSLNELYNSQITKTKQVLRLLYSAYGNSGKDFEELLRMQQQLLKYEMAKATVTKNYFLALAQLDYITAKSE